MPCPLHRMVLRLKWKKMWTSVKSYCNCKGLINVIPLVNVLCSTYLEGIMPPVPLMCVEVANALQRFGLKRGQLCLAPHFAGSEVSLFLFFFSFGDSISSQVLTSVETEWENAQADTDFEISDRTQGWKHLSIIHFRLWGSTGSPLVLKPLIGC